MVIYPSGENNTSNVDILNEVRAGILDNEILIKVKETCKDYMSKHDVERVDVGSKNYYLISEESHIHKVLDNFYLFKLREVK